MENDQMMNAWLDEVFQTGSVDLMQQALDQGWGINEYWGGATMLWQAAAAGKFELTKFLLEKGADPFLQDDEDGNIPITMSYLNKNYKICELLVNHLLK